MISIESEERPWGSFYVIHDEKTYKLKRIEINPGQRLSYQLHNKRSETWTIVQGKGIITLDGVVKEYQMGDSIFISKGTKHRINNTGKKLLIIIEVQTGTYFGEDDIIRLEDDYRRV